MRTKTAHPLIAVATLMAVAFTIWPGCITPPLPSTRKAIMDRKKPDFKLANKDQITRSEVIEKFGKPDEEMKDLNIIAYRVNDVTRRNLFLLFFVIPVGVQTRPGYQDVALIEFNANDRVQRSTIVQVPGKASLFYKAQLWAAEKKR